MHKQCRLPPHVANNIKQFCFDRLIEILLGKSHEIRIQVQQWTSTLEIEIEEAIGLAGFQHTAQFLGLIVEKLLIHNGVESCEYGGLGNHLCSKSSHEERKTVARESMTIIVQQRMVACESYSPQATFVIPKEDFAW